MASVSNRTTAAQPRRAAIYARVSTDRQSVEGQIEFAREWAPKHGYTLTEIYADSARSGTIPFAEREAGRRLLTDLRAGLFDVVLVYKYDRLGRDKEVGDIETRQAILDIERAGGQIVAMTQPIDASTIMGRFTRSVQIDIGTIERLNTLERSADTLATLVRRPGFFTGGTAPYGYRVEGQDRDARLVVDEEPIPGLDISPADVVRMIYRWLVSDGRSTVWIAAELNRRGIPTRALLAGRARPTAGIWRPGRVSTMVRNTVYKGVAVYGRRKSGRSPFPVPLTEREVPAIVDVETWEAAQEQLRRNKKRAKRNAKRQYLLSGLVKCGACGSNYTGLAYTTKDGQERRYYTCNNIHQRHNTGGERCTNPALSWQYEELIWSDIDAWLENPGPILEELAAQLNTDADDAGNIEADIERRRRQLAGQEKERERLLTAYRKGIIDDTDLERELAAMRRERAVLEEEIEALKRAQQRREERRAGLVTAAALLEELKARRREGLTFEVKRQVVEALVKEIVVQPDGTPDVTYRFAVINNRTEPCGGTAGGTPRRSRRGRAARSRL